MIIESVDIRHFGKLSDFKASFDSGFNLIEGKAETGKTTLAAFIVYMLYGFPEERTGFSEREHRTPWEGMSASGSMTFTVKDVRYRVDRTSETTERGWRDTYALYNLTLGIPEQGELSPGERFLGVSRECFADTALLSDVRRGGVSPERTADAIENILFSGEERISSARAARALKEAAHELSSADGASGAVAVLLEIVEAHFAVLADWVTCLLRECQVGIHNAVSFGVSEFHNLSSVSQYFTQPFYHICP